MFGAAIPWFILTGVSILEYLYRYRKKKLRTMLRVWGPYTTHLGVLIMIMGYCVSYGLATEESLALEKGNEEKILGFTITVEDVKTEIDGEQLVREIKRKRQHILWAVLPYVKRCADFESEVRFAMTSV